ncbi:hypothetical protein CONPUDRAFT_46098 [Coniophora puteana RWD-64-598 SS2]|uniref:BTB domain-containing protein n=1 Tax=Coniophora puteana (strain RWD-64-598) TaxID=741705 RepID=A0A5M3N719_CONPW|nr:uncharacterized protein CONPUDRAFT_46098 [Coniophora puteana RWD-64-598 SS2]EIW87223.1 hypothetical protein CONPUDRAFT_46098 [Coniophora puteana RWD-64-598 SS2]
MSNADSRLRRDKSLFFDDGNIIIAAAPADDMKGLLFRVHKSILVKHSPVFADMFTLPDLPSDTQDQNNLYEGLPVIPMYDKAQDVRGLLRFFYDAPSFILDRYDPKTAERIFGILALAKKSQITPLWNRLVKHIKRCWPQTLTAWDVLESDAKIRHNQRYDEELIDLVPYNDDIFPEPGFAIHLARTLDIREILPAAFYHLSRLKISHDRSVKEDTLDDMSEVRHEEISEHLVDYGGRTANWSYLSIQDFRCLLLGRERIERFLPTQLHRFAPAECWYKTCKGKVPEAQYRSLYRSPDVLNDLKYFIPEDEEYSTDDICMSCRKHSRGIAHDIRLTIWDQLAEFFDLPPVPEDDFAAVLP